MIMTSQLHIRLGLFKTTSGCLVPGAMRNAEWAKAATDSLGRLHTA